jgi:hypothetical protein
MEDHNQRPRGQLVQVSVQLLGLQAGAESGAQLVLLQPSEHARFQLVQVEAFSSDQPPAWHISAHNLNAATGTQKLAGEPVVKPRFVGEVSASFNSGATPARHCWPSNILHPVTTSNYHAIMPATGPISAGMPLLGLCHKRMEHQSWSAAIISTPTHLLEHVARGSVQYRPGSWELGEELLLHYTQQSSYVVL